MMLNQRKRFFSYSSGGNDSGSSSNSELPMSNQSLNNNIGYDRTTESPPPSGSFAIDVARMVPGRACSTTVVRQRSGHSLSPVKVTPRKSVSMFFTSTTGCGSNNNIVQSDDLPQHMAAPYGSPSPIVRRSSSSYSSHHSQNNPSGWACTLISMMALIVLSCLVASSHQHQTHLNMELAFKENEIEMHMEHAHNLELRVNQVRSEQAHLHSRIEELEHVSTQPTQEELNIQRQVFHLEHYQEQVHRGIQEAARRMVAETYGPNHKFYIEMKLAFHPDSNIVQDAMAEIDTTIILETASVRDMPHTVHFFLEAVRHGIYDNTAFFRNARDYVQAGPGHDHDKKLQLEQDQPSLTRILMREHSHVLNHKQYTVGFAGRPGGPDFYVNMQDNSDKYGIAEDDPYRVDALLQVDPCFATIVRGFNTMERIHRADVREEEISFRRKQNLMVHPVMIESMRILKDYQHHEDQHHEDQQENVAAVEQE